MSSYALDPTHRVGKHKAKLFDSLLGIKIEHAEDLRVLLLQLVQTSEAEMDEHTEHGHRYRIDCVLTWHDRQSLIRVVWIIRSDETIPRLVTCYPLKKGSQ